MVVACGELKLHASEVHTFSWGSFLARFVCPKVRSLQRLKVEVWAYAEIQKETDLKRLTASVEEALLTLVCLVTLSHEPAEVLNAAC